MVHKSSIIPGISRLVDESILSHYPPTSMKRILMAGAVSLYLKQNENIVDNLANNPLFNGLGIMTKDGFIDIDAIRDTIQPEIKRAGFMRISIPIIGDVDFTSEDIDTLYRFIVEANSNATTPSQHNQTAQNLTNTGVY
jgi:hypothetical protein